MKIFCYITLFLLLSTFAWTDIAVIVNAGNDTTLDKDQIKNIFLGKKHEFSNGSQVKPADQGEDKPIRKEFYLKLAGKDDGEMKVYWSNLIFTGEGTPPKVFNDDAEVKKFIQENTSGISYIDSKSADKSIKVIYTVK
jgi:ABC-type phosphate transport system substrate-binding protein